ncbi:methyltransferase [Kiloniella sp.]|uniref:methyltransferase n=1 Tax=Kiloniella sp. TaxID=1938587 RepID=UPI003B022207
MIEKVWKEGLARRFGAAAQSYETQSEVQQKTATALSNLIKQRLGDRKPLRILEIGCGTGYLTRSLYAHYPDAKYYITDISEDMVLQCQSSILEAANKETQNYGNIVFSIMDGEKPDLEGPFDLICSNMAFQWFRDLKGSLHKLTDLLTPDGVLAFTSLASDTFDLWHRCQEELSIERLAPEFPSANFYEDSLSSLVVEIEKQLFVQRHKSGLEFLQNLKDIGAHSSGLGRKPIGTGQLRRLLKKYESYFTDGPIEADYDVIFVLCSNN